MTSWQATPDVVGFYWAIRSADRSLTVAEVLGIDGERGAESGRGEVKVVGYNRSFAVGDFLCWSRAELPGPPPTALMTPPPAAPSLIALPIDIHPGNVTVTEPTCDFEDEDRS